MYKSGHGLNLDQVTSVLASTVQEISWNIEKISSTEKVGCLLGWLLSCLVGGLVGRVSGWVGWRIDLSVGFVCFFLFIIYSCKVID